MIRKDFYFIVGLTSVTVLMKIVLAVSMHVPNVAPTSVDQNAAVIANGYMNKLRLKEVKLYTISMLGSQHAAIKNRIALKYILKLVTYNSQLLLSTAYGSYCSDLT